MSDLELEEREYWVYQQRRFEAALKFTEIKMVHGNGKAKVIDAMTEAIALADLLIAELEDTRTKTNEDTPF